MQHGPRDAAYKIGAPGGVGAIPGSHQPGMPSGSMRCRRCGWSKTLPVPDVRPQNRGTAATGRRRLLLVLHQCVTAGRWPSPMTLTWPSSALHVIALIRAAAAWILAAGYRCNLANLSRFRASWLWLETALRVGDVAELSGYRQTRCRALTVCLRTALDQQASTAMRIESAVPTVAAITFIPCYRSIGWTFNLAVPVEWSSAFSTDLLGAVLCHRRIREQCDVAVRDSVFGNVQTAEVFRRCGNLAWNCRLGPQRRYQP